MDVRTIFNLVDPSLTEAVRILNSHRDRAGIAAPLHRTSVYCWFRRKTMPATWLQVVAAVILETRPTIGAVQLAFAIAENVPNKTMPYRNATGSSPDRHIDAVPPSGA